MSRIYLLVVCDAIIAVDVCEENRMASTPTVSPSYLDADSGQS